MCKQAYSESGALTRIRGCKEFNLLASERDRLTGVVKGLTEQSQRYSDALRRAEAENARLREALKIVSAVVEGTESVPGAMGVAEYMVCLIGNALKEVG